MVGEAALGRFVLGQYFACAHYDFVRQSSQFRDLDSVAAVGCARFDAAQIATAAEEEAIRQSVTRGRPWTRLKIAASLDGKTAWPIGQDGKHPLRDLLIGDFLILDLAHAFAPGNFLEIESALISNRPHESAGGRWLDDDILDEMLTLFVNGGRGERLGDGVDAPSKPGSLSFPYVREPNKRTELPLPAFLRG